MMRAGILIKRKEIISDQFAFSVLRSTKSFFAAKSLMRFYASSKMSRDSKKCTAVLLRHAWKHMGRHSGYDLLFDELQSYYEDEAISVFQRGDKLLPGVGRVVNRLRRDASLAWGHTVYSGYAELRALWEARTHLASLIHTGYLEEQYGILQRASKYTRARVIATVHQPAGLWRTRQVGHPQMVSRLDGLIVLRQADVAFFEEFLPGRVHYVPHGVMTAFFVPDDYQRNRARAEDPRPRCIFAGQWLRDFPTLERTVELILRQRAEVQFDLVVPRRAFQRGFDFARLARHPQVHWHQGLSDEALRTLYQQADLLLLPLLDCTANNALLEAMSCGLPIVTSLLSGTVDYTQPDFADLLEVGDAEGMATATVRLLMHESERQQRGMRARTYALEHLSWPVVAKKVVEVYQKVLES